jgi:hypothetical protein
MVEGIVLAHYAAILQSSCIADLPRPFFFGVVP